MTSKERWIALAAVALLAGFAGLTGRGWLSTEPIVPRTLAAAARRLPAGPLQVKLPGGGVRDLSAPPGKLLLVHFWATWCPPCLEELPGLLAYSNEIRGNPAVELIAVSVDDSLATAQAWLQERQAGALPIALDEGKVVAGRFGTEKFPETYVVAPDGQIVDYIMGPVDWRSPEWRARLAALQVRGTTANS